MAKILVADDNSNVQKTVTLALGELGVEVVAVNNGDAAVRKLGEFCPDLVLADIFMPVRNGYEVCEYVKKDSRFAHVPVVLLVGAFDPLDEREAQRVGADGILKKPFVPPDPLITMVKTLLERTMGERLVSVAASKPAVSVPAKAGGSAKVEKRPSPVQAIEEFPEEQILPPVGRVSFGEGEHPIAFGQLLDAPANNSTTAEAEAVEPVDDTQILTSARDASLGDPIFWKSEEPAQEADEEKSHAADAEEDISSEPPMRPWKLDEEELSRRAEADSMPMVEPFELVRDERDAEVTQVPSIVAATSTILHDPASQAALTVEPGRLPDLAENPIEWMASVPPPVIEPAPVETPEERAPGLNAEAAGSDAASIRESDEPKDLHGAIRGESSAKILTPPNVSIATSESPAAATPAQSAMKQLAQNAVDESALPARKHDWADMSITLQPEPIEAAPEKDATPTPIHEERAPAGTASGFPSTIAHSSPPGSQLPAQSPDDTARSVPKRDWADLSATLASKPVEAVPVKQEHPVAAPLTQPPAMPATVADAHSSSTASVQPVTKPSTQSTEETARSLPKHDWADMTAALEPIIVEAVQARPEHSGVTPPGASAILPSNLLDPHSSSAPSVLPVAKPSTQNTEDTAHSLPKRDWSDTTAVLSPKTTEAASGKHEHSSVSSVPQPPGTSTTNSQSPASTSSPTSSANAAAPEAKPSTHSSEDTAHSISKQDWFDMASGLPAKPPAAVTERPKLAPGILAHGPIQPVAHAQQPAVPSAQVPSAPVANSKPVSSPTPQVSSAPIPGAPTANTQPLPTSGVPSGQPDPALVEAVVQRVLDKMRPQVVDIITKEFLRPVVQALVHREITKR